MYEDVHNPCKQLDLLGLGMNGPPRGMNGHIVNS